MNVPPALNAGDAAGVFVVVAFFLVLSYFRSRNHMFWGDEIMGRLVLTQPNLSSLLHTWRAGLDSSGICFYLLSRPWMDVFGAGEVSLRMFSAAGMCAAVGVFWVTARRFYPVLPVAASVLFFFSAVPALRWQLANGRTYGVFMLACSVVLFLFVRGLDQREVRPSWFLVLATFAAYALLTGSHILGMLYSGAFLCIQIALDVRQRRVRPALYLSAALAIMLVVLFSLPNLKATTALGKPHFWTVRPPLHDLFTGAVLFDRNVHIVLGAVFLVSVAFLRIRRQRMPVYIVLLGFVALDVVFFAISRVSTSIYVDRYMLPFVFGGMLLLCEMLTQLGEASAPLPKLRAAFPLLLFLVAGGFFFLPALQVLRLPLRNYTGSLMGALPPGLPVVDTSAGRFVEVEFYQHDVSGRRLLYPVDWEVVLDPTHSGDVSGAHEMDNFKMLGIYADDILPTASILAENRSFVLLSNGPSLWLNRRVLSNPAYTVTHYGTYKIPDAPPPDNVIDLWLVNSR